MAACDLKLMRYKKLNTCLCMADGAVEHRTQWRFRAAMQHPYNGTHAGSCHVCSRCQHAGKLTFHGVHHVALICANLERSLEFYQGVLGKLPHCSALLCPPPPPGHLQGCRTPPPPAPLLPCCMLQSHAAVCMALGDTPHTLRLAAEC